MHLIGKRITRGAMLCAVATVLAACGGGGGGGDGGGNSPLVPNPTENLRLTFLADRTSLPLNIAGEAPAIGSAYTATVTLRASFVPGGGTQGGNCWSATFAVISGAASGVLATTSGAVVDPTEQFRVSSSGSWTVLLNSTAQAGTVVIEVAVPNPDTATVTCNDDRVEIGARFTGTPISYIRQRYSITVGQASGKASQIRINTMAPNFLFAQNTGGTTQLQVQAQVLDEAGQRVPDPAAGVRNVYASIVGTASPADDDAKLRSASDGGNRSWALARTVNGQADFSLISGTSNGPVMIEVLADRFDNNVENGIVEPVQNRFSVSVVSSVGQEPLAIESVTDLPAAFQGLPYATVLSAVGGVPPYSWSRVSGSALPAGLSLSSDGVITGIPTGSGVHRFALRVTDSGSIQQSAIKEFSITVEAPPESASPPPPLQIVTTALPAGTINQPYLALLGAAGGTKPYSWSAVGLPTGLTVNSDGIVSGTPTVGGSFSVALTLRDADGASLIRVVSITIQAAGGGDVTPPAVSFTIPANGAVDVSPTALITVVFNEAMDPDSIVPGSFAVYRISSFGGTIQATLPTAASVIAESDRRFSFTADDDLASANNFTPGQSYRVVMSTSPRDIAGNQIAALSPQPANQPAGAPAGWVFEFRIGNPLP